MISDLRSEFSGEFQLKILSIGCDNPIWPKTMSHFSSVGLNKNNNKKSTSGSFSILVSVSGSLEIALKHILWFFSAVSINSSKH